MRKGFWLYQCMAWTAVTIMAALVLWQERTMSEPAIQHAIRFVRVDIQTGARDQYLAQVNAFARDRGLFLRFSQTSPDPNDVVAHLESEDVKIIAVMCSDARELAYDFAFYGLRGKLPAASALDTLVDRLKGFLGQISNAVITDGTPPV
jgi:hypothetical protein